MPGTATAITPRPIEINANAGSPFDPVAAGTILLHNSWHGALSTLDPGGFPYGVVTNILPAPDASPVFFIAGLALHARNIAADSRVSLTLATFGKADVLTQPRMTLVGHARQIAPEAMPGLRARYLARFPKAKLYLQLPDAALFRIEVQGMSIGGGPSRNASAVTFDDFRIDLSDAGPLLDAESAELAALNATPDVVAALALGHGGNAGIDAGIDAGGWRAISLDPAGIGLTDGRSLLRRAFPARVTTAEGFRAAIRALTDTPLPQ